MADEVEAAKRTFQNYINKTMDDESEVLGAIKELSYVDMDIELIRSTGIGRIVRALSKDKRSPQVAAQAKILENQLKALVDPPPAKTPEKRQRTTSTEPQANKRRNVDNNSKSTNSTPNKEKEIETEKKSSAESRSDTGNFKGDSSNPARNAVQVKLYQALGTCKVVGGTESSRVAVAIETTMYKKWGDAKHKDYQAKFRSLFSNLKDPLNEGLRSALFTGDLASDTLIQMSHEELANPSLQQERKKLKVYQQEARRGDRHMLEATCTMFTCNKCGQNKTTYFQMQTRSADEPMTTFVTCCNCGHHWKF
jgi:transcription elongation factor S-II